MLLLSYCFLKAKKGVGQNFPNTSGGIETCPIFRADTIL